LTRKEMWMKRTAAVISVLALLSLQSMAAETRLTTNPADDRWPAWSPDGTRVAFARAGVGLFVVDLEGGAESQLTSGPNDGNPTWSPDGQSIAFERLEGDWDVWVTDDTVGTLVEMTSWGGIKALYR
jgi:Tol biopolymer transport system component